MGIFFLLFVRHARFSKKVSLTNTKNPILIENEMENGKFFTISFLNMGYLFLVKIAFNKRKHDESPKYWK
jgi:hypothetical protein